MERKKGGGGGGGTGAAGQLFLGFQNWKGDIQHHSPDDSLQVLSEGRTMYLALWSLPAS